MLQLQLKLGKLDYLSTSLRNIMVFRYNFLSFRGDLFNFIRSNLPGTVDCENTDCYTVYLVCDFVTAPLPLVPIAEFRTSTTGTVRRGYLAFPSREMQVTSDSMQRCRQSVSHAYPLQLSSELI